MRTGERIGHLVIERPLGAGGMGEVFLALDERLERHVAIKLLPADRVLDPAARLRMLREARAASALDHAGIVRVYDIGEHQGRAFIAMEYVEGETLDLVLERRGKIPPAEAVALLAEIGDAVAAAHESGVLHRDLKPANLVIDRRGHPKVLDFGLSKRTSGPRSIPPESAPAASRRSLATEPTIASHSGSAAIRVSAASETDADAATARPDEVMALDLTTPAPDMVTAYGARMGTPGYAATELMDGEEADRRADVFSLGVILYRMVTGALPFPQRSWSELRTAMERAEFAPAGVARLDAVIARAIAGDREKRFPDVEAFVDAARAAVAPPRRWWPIAAGAGVLAAGVAAVVVVTASGGGAARTPSSTPADAAVAPVPQLDVAHLRQLTHGGGCVYAPAFIGDDTIVYDLTLDGSDSVHRTDREGAPPVRLTDDANTSQWRANPGPPGEVVYVVSDWDGTASLLAARDLAHPETERVIAPLTASSVAYADGAYYYTDSDRADVRRFDGKHDEELAALPVNRVPDGIVIDPTGRRIAFVTIGSGDEIKLCTVTIADGKLACYPTLVDAGRPGFSPDGNALYANGRTGIVRHDLVAGRDDVLAPDIYPRAGITISPSGDLLVFSDCTPRSPLHDVTGAAPVAITKETKAGVPRFGPGGELFYLTHAAAGDTIMRVDTDGTSRELVSHDPGLFDDLAVSADGSQLVYARYFESGSGIYLVGTGDAHTPIQLTDGKSDAAPMFVGDEVVFMRPDDAGAMRPHRVGLDGTDVAAVPGPTRVMLDVDSAHHRALVTVAARRLAWWDPRTGRTTPGPAPPIDYVHAAAISPDGKWSAFLTGEDGGQVWRMRLVGKPRAEMLHDYPAGFSTRRLAISNDGRVIVHDSEWVGELYAIPFL